MKYYQFCSGIIAVVLSLFGKYADGFVLENQNRNFLWDVNRCSNINPIVDSETIILTANGQWATDKFCTAIRRDLKVTDEAPYEISSQFNNLSGKPTGSVLYGHLGFMFNVWDDNNYDFVYKRVHSTTFAYGRVFNGAVQFTSSNVVGNPAISSGNWYTLRIVVQTNKDVELFLNDKKIGSFKAKFTTRGYGGAIVATGYRNVVQFRNFKLSPVITQL